MPLDHSKSPGAFKTNVSTLMHDVGKSPHVKSREQALAIAYSTARRAGAHMASGGFTPPMGERFAARQQFHEGFLHSSVPGRTDKLPISVSGGSYVLPADHVAALGQGNSNAGAAIVSRMFKSGPAGTSAPSLHAAHASVPHLNLTPKAAKFARGGHDGFWFDKKDKLGRTKSKLGHHEPTDIIAAGGEIVLTPQQIIHRFGSLKKGHQALDEWVVQTRKKHVKTLRHLKPPRKD